MSSSVKTGSQANEQLVKLETFRALPVKVLAADDFQTLTTGWDASCVLGKPFQIELNSPKVPEKTALSSLLVELPYHVEKAPPGKHYHVKLALTYGITKSPGSRGAMTVQFGGHTKVVRHDFGKNENGPILVRNYAFNIRAREARTGSLYLNVTLFAERNDFQESIIFQLDAIDVNFALADTPKKRRKG